MAAKNRLLYFYTQSTFLPMMNKTVINSVKLNDKMLIANFPELFDLGFIYKDKITFHQIRVYSLYR